MIEAHQKVAIHGVLSQEAYHEIMDHPRTRFKSVYLSRIGTAFIASVEEALIGALHDEKYV